MDFLEEINRIHEQMVKENIQPKRSVSARLKIFKRELKGLPRNIRRSFPKVIFATKYEDLINGRVDYYLWYRRPDGVRISATGNDLGETKKLFIDKYSGGYRYKQLNKKMTGNKPVIFLLLIFHDFPT